MKTDIRLYNTLKGEKEYLEVQDGKLSIYLCGPTVYDLIHLGNARPLVFFDVVRRYLSKYFEVTFVQNFTDIDDKIIDRAKRENISIKEVSEKYIEEYYKDSKELNVIRADIAPKATEFVNHMIKEVSSLIEKGYGYKKEDGIYFNTSKFSGYGALSGRAFKDIANSENDFAIWKFEEDVKISWDAPFGRGRPGWHLECSTMILNTVGKVDIHAGGQDLIFPHHENEIAQFEAVHKNCCLARYWMHNSFIQIGNNKISKSKGNSTSLRELLNSYSGNIVRFFILSTHYRKPIKLNEDSLDQSEKAFKKLSNFLNKFYIFSEDGDSFSEEIDSLEKSYEQFMQDDFNTQGAIGAIFESLKRFKEKTINKSGYLEYRSLVFKILSDLGFKCTILAQDREIENLIKRRAEKRASKNYVEADKIREELLDRGVLLEEGKIISWSRV